MMADETPKVTEAAAAAEQVKAAPAEAPAPKAKAAPEPAPEPAEPEPERMTVKMANAANGARFPGEVVDVDAETGWALIRAGEASPA